MFIKDGLATLLLLPAIWVILDSIGRLVREKANISSLGTLAEIFVPVVVAMGIAWYFNVKGKPRLGVGLGILAVFVGYMLLLELETGQATAECRIKYPGDFLCGEAAGFVFLQLIEWFTVNAIALVGVGYWFDRLRRRDSAAKSHDGSHRT
jgi:hypothetical protein